MECPCGGVTFNNGSPDQDFVCPKCGRRWHKWSDGSGEFFMDPAITRINQAESDMRSHFLSIERQLRSIRKLLMDKERQAKSKEKLKKRGERGLPGL